MEGETGVQSTEDGYKMVFKSLDGFFHLVVSVVVWGYKLVGHLVELGLLLEKFGAFVVENVLFGEDACHVEAINDGFIRSYHFSG
jgi:hypothetical protein